MGLLRFVLLPWLLFALLPNALAAKPYAASEVQAAAKQESVPSGRQGSGPAPTQPAGTPVSGVQAAQQLAWDGKFSLALKAVDALLAANPNSLDALDLKARILVRQGDVDGAWDAAKLALKISPDTANENLVMGEVLFRRGDIAEANEYLQKTLKIAPANTQAWLALSRVAQAVSLRKKAKACIEKAYSLAPDDPDVLLAWAQTRPTRAEAIAGYEKFLEAEARRTGSKPQWAVNRLEDWRKIGQLETNVLASPMAHYDIPIEYVLQDSAHLRGWGISVAIGSCRPAKLMIDTGASGIVINRNLADKCNVTKLYDGYLTGVGDKPPIAAYTGLADRVRVGPVEFKNALIDVEDRRSIADEAGLIGTDVLQKFLIRLNLSEYKLSLDPLPPIPGAESTEGPQDRYVAPEMAKYAVVFRFGHLLVIPTKVGDDPKSVLFLIDTGAQMNNIAREYVAKLQKLTEEQFVEIRGVQGKVQKVFSADDLTLQFAGFRQMNQSLLSFDLSRISNGSGVQVSGILGLTVLRWFTLNIDYRDGLVGFDYHEPHGADNHRLH